MAPSPPASEQTSSSSTPTCRRPPPPPPLPPSTTTSSSSMAKTPPTPVLPPVTRKLKKPASEYSTNPNTMRVRQRNANLTPYRAAVERARSNDLKAVSAAWRNRSETESFRSADEETKKKMLAETEKEVMDRRRRRGIDADSRIRHLNSRILPDSSSSSAVVGTVDENTFPLMAPPGYKPFPAKPIPELWEIKKPKESKVLDDIVASSTALLRKAAASASVSVSVSTSAASPEGGVENAGGRGREEEQSPGLQALIQEIKMEDEDDDDDDDDDDIQMIDVKIKREDESPTPAFTIGRHPSPEVMIISSSSSPSSFRNNNDNKTKDAAAENVARIIDDYERLQKENTGLRELKGVVQALRNQMAEMSTLMQQKQRPQQNNNTNNNNNNDNNRTQTQIRLRLRNAPPHSFPHHSHVNIYPPLLPPLRPNGLAHDPNGQMGPGGDDGDPEPKWTDADYD
ncbi:hypothetical protein GGS20DRAFT_570760 [Poronia punctata]|nr:hypothetical protein GGS20DRAFT_570760 [Poronia punctata]